MGSLEALGISEIVVITLIMALGSLVQATIGFGMALIAAPLLLLVNPEFVPGPIIVGGLSLTLMVAVRDRKAIDFGNIRWLIVGRAPGAGMGAWLLAAAPAASLDGLLAGMILLAVVVTVLGPPLRPTPRTLVGAGVVSGVMGTIVSIGGPPVALLLQRDEGSKLRATLSGYFIFSSSLSLGALTWFGQFDPPRLQLGLQLIPGAVLGFALSTPLRGLVDRNYTRPLVLVLSTFAAVTVLLR